MSEDCLICREHRGDVPPPGGHLVSTDEVIAFHAPPWPESAPDVYLGYLMVTPRRHAAGFADLTDAEAAAVGRTLAALSRALKAVGAEHVYSLTVGHGWPHLHVQLIPRWPGTPDDVPWLHVDDWPGARRGDAAAATALAERLRDALAANRVEAPDQQL